MLITEKCERGDEDAQSYEGHGLSRIRVEAVRCWLFVVGVRLENRSPATAARRDDLPGR